jgi:hypothetical protein
MWSRWWVGEGEGGEWGGIKEERGGEVLVGGA